MMPHFLKTGSYPYGSPSIAGFVNEFANCHLQSKIASILPATTCKVAGVYLLALLAKSAGSDTPIK